jgi:hypothetical protein
VKVAGSSPDKVNYFFFSIYVIFPAALGPAICSASNRNEYHKQKNMFLSSRTRPARKAHCVDNVGSSTSHNPISLNGLLLG